MTLLLTELKKLNGSLALLVAVAAPALPGFLAMLALLTNDEPASWSDSFRFALPLWCLFLAPMVVAAFTTLMGQIEHRGRGWDHLMALPIARWRIFAAKILIIFATTIFMTLLVIGFTVLGTLVGGALGPGLPEENFPLDGLIEKTILIFLSMATLVAVQSWVAYRFANFVIPLAVGIGGTLVAISVAMTRTEQANLFPWVWPFNALIMPDPQPYAIAGGVLGCVVTAAMLFDLTRREIV